MRKRAIWRQDVYVDTGLTVLARADATIRNGRVITMSEAITRLADLGVPAEIVAFGPSVFHRANFFLDFPQSLCE